jgi:hypothetical protein
MRLREVHTERHAYNGVSTSSLNYKSPGSITMFPFTCFPVTFFIQYCDIWNTASLADAVQTPVDVLVACLMLNGRILPNADAGCKWYTGTSCSATMDQARSRSGRFPAMHRSQSCRLIPILLAATRPWLYRQGISYTNCEGSSSPLEDPEQWTGKSLRDNRGQQMGTTIVILHLLPCFGNGLANALLPRPMPVPSCAWKRRSSIAQFDSLHASPLYQSPI